MPWGAKDYDQRMKEINTNFLTIMEEVFSNGESLRDLTQYVFSELNIRPRALEALIGESIERGIVEDTQLTMSARFTTECTN